MDSNGIQGISASAGSTNTKITLHSSEPGIEGNNISGANWPSQDNYILTASINFTEGKNSFSISDNMNDSFFSIKSKIPIFFNARIVGIMVIPSKCKKSCSLYL